MVWYTQDSIADNNYGPITTAGGFGDIVNYIYTELGDGIFPDLDTCIRDPNRYPDIQWVWNNQMFNTMTYDFNFANLADTLDQCCGNETEPTTTPLNTTEPTPDPTTPRPTPRPTTPEPTLQPTECFAEVDCITVTSTGFGVFGNKRVSCRDAGDQYSNYVMTGCGWWSAWMNTATSVIVGTPSEQAWCVATVTGAGGRVQAVAQCCDIQNYTNGCGTVQNNGGALTTAVCPATSTVVGCVSAGEACAHDINCDTSFSTGNQPILNQQCTGHQQFNTVGNADIQSVCCQEAADVAMECHQIIGPATGPGNDDLSTISCKDTLGSEWFLTSCDEYVETTVLAPRLDGHYAWGGGIPANDICVVRNSGFNGVTYPVAQCCRIGSVHSNVGDFIILHVWYLYIFIYSGTR